MAVTWKKVAYGDLVILKALLTEQGDVIYASGVATPAALVHGTSGQVLISGGHGANPSWATPAGGATLTVAETEVFNGNSPATAAFTDLNLSSVVGTNYALVILKVYLALAAGGASFATRKNGDVEIAGLFGMGIGSLYKTASGSFHYVACPTDSGGIIEWYYSLTTSAVTIDVVAYIK